MGDGGFGSTSAAVPALDLSETDNEIVVTASVPGIKPDDLKITLVGDTLEISGETSSESEHKEATYHLRERRSGSFRRTVLLPAPVIGDQAKAEFENGVLTLTLPKAEAARRKSIAVKPKRK
jgi:HSP20 family protein